MAFSERGFRRADSIPVSVLEAGQNEILARVNQREVSPTGPLPGDIDLRRRTMEALISLRAVPETSMPAEDWFKLYEHAVPLHATAEAILFHTMNNTAQEIKKPQDILAEHYWTMCIVTEGVYALKAHGFIAPQSYEQFCTLVDETKRNVEQTVAVDCLPPSMSYDRITTLEDPLHELVSQFIEGRRPKKTQNMTGKKS